MSAWEGTDVALRDGVVLRCVPLVPERWSDLEALFGPNGAASGCWCMYWRKPGKDWSDNAENKRLFHERVEQGAIPGARTATPTGDQTPTPPGLLGCLGERAVGWVQIAPRSEFLRIERSRNLAPPDDTPDDAPVWSLNCFMIHRTARRRGVASALVTAAVDFARHHGATTIEAYPVDRPQAGTCELYTGTPRMFTAAGFHEVARRHPSRPIVRLDL
jgi:GNAT superfamily N-acetyltransferase